MAKMQQQGIQPNVIACAAVMSACKRSTKDQWPLAVSLLAKMQVQGIQPDVITCIAAMSACQTSTKNQWLMAV